MKTSNQKKKAIKKEESGIQMMKRETQEKKIKVVSKKMRGNKEKSGNQGKEEDTREGNKDESVEGDGGEPIGRSDGNTDNKGGGIKRTDTKKEAKTSRKEKRGRGRRRKKK